MSVLDPSEHRVMAGTEYLVEHEQRHVQSRDGACLPRSHRRGGNGVCGHRRVGGGVGPVPQVLVESLSHESAGLVDVESGGQHGGHVSSLL